jgi:elongation factor Ts
MSVDIALIKKIRDRTGLPMNQCKEALEASHGDIEAALEHLKETGALIASKKSGRDLGAGSVQSYVHGHGTVAALAELLCETDFVARNPEFQTLAKDIAMQIAASPDEILDAGAEEVLKQPFFKDPSITVSQLIEGAVQKFGERTELGRFVKYTI